MGLLGEAHQVGEWKLQPKILAAIVHRCAKRAHLHNKVTVHTLRHTAATWLRQGAADTWLVVEYLGHADLSTVGPLRARR